MEMENNFDSDTSESWSLIDLNYEHSTEINLPDEIGVEVFETKPGEVMSNKRSALFREQGENGLPDDVIDRDDVNVASAYDHLKNQPDFQILYKSKIFEDDCDLELKSEPNGSKSNLDGDENIDPETKDLDEDTDGISVISESEYNDIKVAAYESDEVWDEKPSESDGNENPLSNILRRKRKALKLSYGESSEESVNSDMVPEEIFCSESNNLKSGDNGMQRKQYRTAPANRNNILNLVLSIIMGIILAAISFIAIVHFLGVQEYQESTGHMAQTVRKLQKENVLLHLRLTQLSRAVLARGVNKQDLKEETEAPCLKDDYECRKAVLKFYKNDVDEGNYDLSFFRQKDSFDFSIPLNHHKNVLALKQILSGNGALVPRESTEPDEPFNHSKYVETLAKDHFAVVSTSGPEGVTGEVTKPTEPESEQKLEPKDREPDQKDEIPENKNCQTGGLTSQDDDTQRENCLAIHEKDLSQFRWFILKDKPKCSGIKVEDLTDLESECLYEIPMDKKYRKETIKEQGDSNAVIEETNILKGDELDFTSNQRNSDLSFLIRSIHDNDEPKRVEPPKKDLRSKKTKIRDIHSAERFFYNSENLSKKKKKDEKEKVQIDYADKYLKYFEKVVEYVNKNKGKMKECIMNEDGRCEPKFRNENESNQAPNENYKKNVEKRSKEDWERKNSKKGELPNIHKNRTYSRSKKWKSCSIKPTLKWGNESKCEGCASKSGDWFSKWGEGRERCRRDQKISDWQFERAKSRAHSRVGDAFWQFSRAYGRQNRRMYPYSRKKKVKYFSGKGFSFKSHSRI